MGQARGSGTWRNPEGARQRSFLFHPTLSNKVGHLRVKGIAKDNLRFRAFPILQFVDIAQAGKQFSGPRHVVGVQAVECRHGSHGMLGHCERSAELRP